MSNPEPKRDSSREPVTFSVWWRDCGDAVIARLRRPDLSREDVERCVRIGWNASRVNEK